MEVQVIVAKWLRANGYDGLYTEDCGCELADLAPCGEMEHDCKAGYKVPCPGVEDCGAYGDCDFHISSNKSPQPDRPERKE